MFKSFTLLCICVFAAGVSAQAPAAGFDLSNYGVRIEPDKRVMIVLAAVESARTTNAAGEEVAVVTTPLSAEGVKFRDLLKSDLAAMPADLRQRISTFMVSHKKRYPNLSDAELVAPFISMAYALTPAPELADPVVTTDLPGNLLDVLDFAPLVRDFYRRSSIGGNINEYVKTYKKTADGRLRSSTREMASDILGYLNTKPQLFVTEKVKTETGKSKSKRRTLRQVELRDRERTFTIVPEMLAPLNTVNFVNIKDDYFVVVPAELTGDRELSTSEVRRGFLQFVIDPMVYSMGKDIETIKPLVKKLLEERRKIDQTASPDVYLTISRSMVAAVDAKQAEFVRVRAMTTQARQRIDAVKTDAEKRAIVQELDKVKTSLSDETALRLSEDYEKGAILSFYFAEQLNGFEGSGFDIASSMKDMVLVFDGTKETDRLGQFAEARKRATAARDDRKKNPTATNVIVENPVTNKLVEIQKLIDAKNYVQASAELKQLREKNPAEPRIYYNIGRVASLSAEAITEEEKQKAKLLEAKVAFENVLRTATNTTDAALLSLTYVALAKIYEFYNERTYAIAVYDKAIQLGPVNGGAHAEALNAKARLIKEQ
ncbi:MAG: hypothetical protein HOP17_00160 [Acidobacteria bacterium]|nr:hypothetical protein [Acidobacteriota bacterium]